MAGSAAAAVLGGGGCLNCFFIDKIWGEKLRRAY